MQPSHFAALFTPILGPIFGLLIVSHVNPPTNVRPRESIRLNVQLDGKWVGTSTCSQCHSRPSPDDRNNKITEFVYLHEYIQWIQSDVHALSYLRVVPSNDLLANEAAKYSQLQINSEIDPEFQVDVTWSESNELSAQICRKLGIDVDALANLTNENALTDKSSAAYQFAHMCLNCHANCEPDETSLSLDVQRFGLGVGCEACHGPAQQWYERSVHGRTEWRQKDPQEKSEDYGMVDVRDPVIRAKQCFACHIGNASQGKVITHEMYAAGHPPLPGIEIESYAKQMPRHWRYLHEKGQSFEYRDDFIRENNLNTAAYPSSKAVVIGAITAYRESLNLVIELAQAENHPWPEFAVFDCLACHHDLKVNSWRQRQVSNRQPGRPPLQFWPTALLDPAMHQLAGADSVAHLHGIQQQVTSVLNDQPFGRAAELAELNESIEWLDKKLNELNKRSFGRADAESVLKSLCGASSDNHLNIESAVMDYHSARQIAWAIDAIYGELRVMVSAPFPGYDSAFGAAFHNLKQSVGDLSLPAGSQPRSITVAEDADQILARFVQSHLRTTTFINELNGEPITMLKEQVLEEELQSILTELNPDITSQQAITFAAIDQFDPREFVTHLRALGQALPAELARLNGN